MKTTTDLLECINSLGMETTLETLIVKVVMTFPKDGSRDIYLTQLHKDLMRAYLNYADRNRGE